MIELCHRCGADLPHADGSSSFCPHCGAPQLYLKDYTAAESTGEPPPDAPSGSLAPIDWKPAITSAAMVGGIAGLLSLLGSRFPALSGLGSMWIFAASLIALAIYQHRRPRARIDAGIGARIGLIVGLALALGLASAGVVAGLFQRYVRHAMGSWDATITQQMHTAMDRNAASSPVPPDLARFFLSPEFRAGMMLVGALGAAAFLLLFSTLGGALGGILRARRAASLSR